LVLVLWIIYDITVSVDLYELNGAENVKTFADVVINLVFTSHSSCIFLLLSFLHVLFKTTFPKQQFMSQLEFKVYVVYSVISFICYPIIQFALFSPTSLDFIIIPQFIYWIEMLISSVLYIALIVRMRRVQFNVAAHKKTRVLVMLVTLLLVMLVVVDMVIASSLNIINLGLIAGQVRYGSNYTQYSFHQLQQLDYLLVDNLTCVFSTFYLPLALIITCILNITEVQHLYIYVTSPTPISGSTLSVKTKTASVIVQDNEEDGVQVAPEEQEDGQSVQSET